jgi:hypothetical protein
MYELNEFYTLDEALKLYALMRMRNDVEQGMIDSINNKNNEERRR